MAWLSENASPDNLTGSVTLTSTERPRGVLMVTRGDLKPGSILDLGDGCALTVAETIRCGECLMVDDDTGRVVRYRLPESD